MEENESAVDQQTATQAASGRSVGATGDAAALRADGGSLSSLRPLGGDAGEPPLRPVRVALTRPAAPRVTHVRPLSILYYMYLILSNSLCHLSLSTVRVILYSTYNVFVLRVQYWCVCNW